MPRARRPPGVPWAALASISRRDPLPRRRWEPPHAPLRPRASPQAPPTPVHELPRPTELPLEPSPPSGRRGFASKWVGSRLPRVPAKQPKSWATVGIFFRGGLWSNPRRQEDPFNFSSFGFSLYRATRASSSYIEHAADGRASTRHLHCRTARAVRLCEGSA
eukprot:scaffold13037_cov63-Phaeocystis_antarctica.AAC.1